MALNCPPIRIQQFDENGDPAVGYKLYSYVTGTTTPKATYVDTGGITPNPNPTILDARGEASLFLEAGAYRFVLKTAADVTVWTQDGISAPSAGSGISVSATGAISIDEASAAEAYSMTNAENVVTTKRLRDIYYSASFTADATPARLNATQNASGWTISQLATGQFLITHGIGLSDPLNFIPGREPGSSWRRQDLFSLNRGGQRYAIQRHHKRRGRQLCRCKLPSFRHEGRCINAEYRATGQAVFLR